MFHKLRTRVWPGASRLPQHIPRLGSRQYAKSLVNRKLIDCQARRTRRNYKSFLSYTRPRRNVRGWNNRVNPRPHALASSIFKSNLREELHLYS